MKILGVLCLLAVFGATDVFARALTSSSRSILKSGQWFKPPAAKNWHQNEDFLKMLAEVNSDQRLGEEARNLVLSNHGEDRLAEFDLMLAAQRVSELGENERLAAALGILAYERLFSRAKQTE